MLRAAPSHRHTARNQLRGKNKDDKNDGYLGGSMYAHYRCVKLDQTLELPPGAAASQRSAVLSGVVSLSRQT